MNKVRYGVIGIKGIGELHCRYAIEHEKVELAALVDKDEEALKNRAKELHVPYFTDHRDMLESGQVDAVSIATPHHLHSNIGLDCLRSGVHIYMEKPIANRVSEADGLIRAAKEKNLKICVGHQYRVHRTSKTMKHLIETKAIGNVIRVLWTWGVFRSEKYFSRENWHRTWQHAGGGILMTHAVHDLDLVCWMIGKPVRVSAILSNQIHSIEGEDMASASILFENGALASFQATVNQPEAFSVRQVAGDKGVIVIQDLKSMTFDHKDRILVGKYEDNLQSALTNLPGIMDQPGTTWRTVKPIGDPPAWKKLLERLGLAKIRRNHGICVLMDSFVQSILDGGEPLVSGESAIAPLELVNAMVLSAVRNKPVDLPIDREEYDVLYEELCSGKTGIPKYSV